MGKVWRTSKSRMVEKIINAENDEQRMKLKPDNIASNIEWKKFVREKLSAEFKVCVSTSKNLFYLSVHYFCLIIYPFFL